MKTFIEFLGISLLGIILGVGTGYLLKDFPDCIPAVFVASVQWIFLILLLTPNK